MKTVSRQTSSRKNYDERQNCKSRKNWKNVQINNRKQCAFLSPRPANSVGRALDSWFNDQEFQSLVGRELSFFIELEAWKLWVDNRHQERITMSGRSIGVEKPWKNVQINNRKQSAFLSPRPANSVGRELDFWFNDKGFESLMGRQLSFFKELEAGIHENCE